MKTLPLLLLATLPLAACSWGIKLDAGGQQVRTAWDGNVAGCRDAGRITVSVLDRVGPVDRSGTKVRDELEVMARNEAASLGADTVRPLGEPADGQQSWQAYTCGAAAARTQSPPPRRDEGAAETFPIKDQ